MIVVLALSVRQLDHKVDGLQQARASSEDLARGAAHALATPDARIARLTGTGGVAVAVVRANGQGYVLADGLPALDRRVYELWGASESGQIASLGTIPGPGVYAFAADPSVHMIMVTAEDRLVSAPTSAPIVSGILS